MNAPAFAQPERAARVLLVLGSLDGGGAERVAVTLLQRCDAREVDIHVGLLRTTGAYLESVDRLRVSGPKARGTGLAAALMAPRDIAGMISKVRPQVVMSFGMGVNLAVAQALPRGDRRPRWICREDSNTAAEIANLSGNPAARAIVTALTRKAHGAADCLLAVAGDLGAQLTRETPGARVRVIHNPIDLAMIEPLALAPLTAAPDRPFIVAAGRLVRQKGFDLLIEAFAGAVRTAGMDLVILGEGPLEADLRRQAAALGVGGRVKFPGFQANPWAWFARAKLFALSSRWEGFGNVVAEAMACGVTVLASDCDFGPREQVGHGVSGWLVAPGSSAALSEGMDTLLANPVLAAKLAASGRERAGAFDVDRIVAPYTRLFRDLAFTGAAAAF
jgi:glycosyltransferase involved in cell wall biosynthesis